MQLKIRLIVMNFLVFAVWGSYLTSMGSYLASVGMGMHIGWFYSVQGIVSLFMPAMIGIVADRWIPAQKMLSICHFLAAIFMALTGYMGMVYGDQVTFAQLFPFYTMSVPSRHWHFGLLLSSLQLLLSYFYLLVHHIFGIGISSDFVTSSRRLPKPK